MKGWNILGNKWTVDGLEAGKMSKHTDLNNKGQMLMTRRVRAAGWFWYALVGTYQKWSEEGQPVTQQQGHGRSKLINACEEWRLVHLVWSQSRASVAQIAEKVHTGYDRKESTYITVPSGLVWYFLLHCVHGWMHVAYLEKKCYQDALKKKAIWQRQCDNPVNVLSWILLAFMWMFLWHLPPT